MDGLFSFSKILSNSFLNDYQKDDILDLISSLKNKELFRRISASQWESIEQELYKVHTPLTEDEIEALRCGSNWKQLFNRSDLLAAALIAHGRGKISEDDLIRLFLLDSCRQQSKTIQKMIQPEKTEKNFQWMKLCNLKKDNEISERPWSILLNSLGNFISSDKKNGLKEKIQELPAATGQFYILAYPKISSLYHRIVASKKNDGLGWHFLTYKESENSSAVFPRHSLIARRWQVILQPQLANTILTTIALKDAIQMLPVIGYSPIEDMSVLSERVSFIPCSLLSSSTLLPMKESSKKENYLVSEAVHGFFSSPPGVLHHDFYHLSIEAHNVHREIWIDFAKYLDKQHSTKFAEKIHDREFSMYFLKKEIPVDQLFWISMASSLDYLHSKGESYENLSSLIVDYFREKIAQESVNHLNLYQSFGECLYQCRYYNIDQSIVSAIYLLASLLPSPPIVHSSK